MIREEDPFPPRPRKSAARDNKMGEVRPDDEKPGQIGL